MKTRTTSFSSVAQLVEQSLRKAKVAGSSPVTGSITKYLTKITDHRGKEITILTQEGLAKGYRLSGGILGPGWR